MTKIRPALLWAGLVLVCAVVMSAMNVDDAASLAVTIGLSGGAWAALSLEGGCAGRCLQ